MRICDPSTWLRVVLSLSKDDKRKAAAKVDAALVPIVIYPRI